MASSVGVPIQAVYLGILNGLISNKVKIRTVKF